jgi:hypothetical protein
LIDNRKAQEVSWFKKHLNVTLVLSWILALLVWFTFGGNIWFNFGSVSVQVSPGISSKAFGEWAEWMSWLGPPAIILLVTGWYLRKKNRSTLNFFWYLLFPPIGALILLCLENRSEKQVTG